MGLPLSIVVTGGHLKRSSRVIEYWKKVSNYMNPISSIGEEEQCLEILRLSYQHLPACLKPCFLYLGIYREDELIGTSDILQCWIGEGFLKPKKGSSLEEVGEDYLRDLNDRNLVLLYQSSWNGKVGHFKVHHDTLREMCLEVCKKERFLCVIQDSTQAKSDGEHRLVILDGGKLNPHIFGARHSSPLLRSLAYRRGNAFFLNKLLVDCNLLRVLVCGLDTCSLDHFEQVNLRALVFDQYSNPSIESVCSIVSSIPACWNLQTLHTKTSFYEPITLPYEIWEMPQLRHLRFELVYLPDPALSGGSEQEEFIVLQNLYTLEGVLNLRFTEEVCKRMPNLKTLYAKYNRFRDDYCFHNLGRFNELKSLDITFDVDPQWCDVVPSLTLPSSLEELSLSSSHLKWEDLTMMISSQLPHLGVLHVGYVRGSEWNLYDQDEFGFLKRLEIHGCADLIHWNANNSNFPVLESLHLSYMPKLSEIPLYIGEIPTLRHIELRYCSTSAAVSAVRIVMEQEANGNQYLQVHVKFLKIDCEGLERFQEMLKEECLTTRTNNIHIYLLQ